MAEISEAEYYAAFDPNCPDCQAQTGSGPCCNHDPRNKNGGITVTTGAESTPRTLVVVLTRAIPVSDYSTDTLTRVCRDGETVADLMAWADRYCNMTAPMVRLEITRESL